MSWLPSNKSRWTRFKEALSGHVLNILMIGVFIFWDLVGGYPSLAALDVVTIGLVYVVSSARSPLNPVPSQYTDGWRPSLASPLVITPSRWTVGVPIALVVAAVAQIVMRQYMTVRMTEAVGNVAIMWSLSVLGTLILRKPLRELRLESDGLWVTAAKGRFFIPWAHLADVQRSAQHARLILTLTTTEGMDAVAHSFRVRLPHFSIAKPPENQLELPLNNFTLDVDGLAALLRRYSLAGQPEPTAASLPAPFPMVATHE